MWECERPVRRKTSDPPSKIKSDCQGVDEVEGGDGKTRNQKRRQQLRINRFPPLPPLDSPAVASLQLGDLNMPMSCKHFASDRSINVFLSVILMDLDYSFYRI